MNTTEEDNIIYYNLIQKTRLRRGFAFVCEKYRSVNLITIGLDYENSIAMFCSNDLNELHKQNTIKFKYNKINLLNIEKLTKSSDDYNKSLKFKKFYINKFKIIKDILNRNASYKKLFKGIKVPNKIIEFEKVEETDYSNSYKYKIF